MLLEILGVAGSWGPLAGKIKPMTGGILYWLRPGTIRLPPWRQVPFTAGDRRTWSTSSLYVAFLVSLVVALVLPGVHSESLSAALPANTSGLVTGPADRADGAAGPHRAARQDDLPGRARRAVPARAGLLRRPCRSST